MNLIIQMALKRQGNIKPSNCKYLLSKGEFKMDVLSFISSPFLLVGGHATSYYMPPRYTKDIDILLRESDFYNVHKQLLKHGAIYKNDLLIGGASYTLNNMDLDIIYSKELWLEEAMTTCLHDHIKVISLPYLILMKLKASRVQDLADCSKMLGYASAEIIKEVKQVVLKYSPNDYNDLESLILLGKYEVSY